MGTVIFALRVAGFKRCTSCWCSCRYGSLCFYNRILCCRRSIEQLCSLLFFVSAFLFINIFYFYNFYVWGEVYFDYFGCRETKKTYFGFASFRSSWMCFWSRKSDLYILYLCGLEFHILYTIQLWIGMMTYPQFLFLYFFFWFSFSNLNYYTIVSKKSHG